MFILNFCHIQIIFHEVFQTSKYCLLSVWHGRSFYGLGACLSSGVDDCRKKKKTSTIMPGETVKLLRVVF